MGGSRHAPAPHTLAPHRLCCLARLRPSALLFIYPFILFLHCSTQWLFVSYDPLCPADPCLPPLAPQGDLSAISVLRVVQLLQERLGHYLPEFMPSDRVSKELPALLSKVAGSPSSVGMRPSLLAAAVLAVVRRIKGCVPAWPMALQVRVSWRCGGAVRSCC